MALNIEAAIAASSKLLDLCLATTATLSDLLSKELREGLSSPVEREFAADLALGALRRFGTYEALLASQRELTPLDRAFIAVLLELGNSSDRHRIEAISISELFTRLPALSSPLKHRFHELQSAWARPLPPELFTRFAFPEWMRKELGKKFSPEQVGEISRFSLSPAPVFIRVNRLKISRNELIPKLAGESIAVSESAHHPDALIAPARARLEQTRAWREGLFEIQDESSQWVSTLADPRPGQRILDLCAGAGGKSLHLASITDNQAEIVATDRRREVLSQLARRRDRAEAKIEILTKEKALKRGPFDLILIDAPCSGSGTFRRHPEQRWRFTEDALHELAATQRGLLEEATSISTQSTLLVYVTCSLFPSENDDRIRSFLADHPEIQVTLPQTIPEESLQTRFGTAFGGGISLRNQGDGFFVSTLIQRG